MSFAIAACGGGNVNGTYSSPTGLAMIDLESGGKATTTQMGTTAECTCKVDGKQVNVTCNGDTEAYRLNDDGSLTGPGLIGVMKKAK